MQSEKWRPMLFVHVFSLNLQASDPMRGCPIAASSREPGDQYIPSLLLTSDYWPQTSFGIPMNDQYIMETKYTQKSPQEDQFRNEIFLVGFSETSQAQDTPPIRRLIQGLVPEAHVLTQPIYNNKNGPSIRSVDLEEAYDADGIEDEINSLPCIITCTNGTDGTEIATSSVHVTSMTGHDDFSPNWIQSEALNLLNRIAQQCDTGVQGKRIILSGRGFGGIVIKQAVLIANTTPRFYHVALSIASLVFFTTPHRPTEDVTWEQAMLELIQGDGTCRDRSRPFMLSVLANFVSQLSHVFYRFASKYPIANFVYGRHAVVQQFSSDFETVVSWKRYVDSDARFDPKQTLNNYESLRRHFSPFYIPPSSHHSPAYDDHGSAASSPRAFNGLYLDALRVFAPSRWTIDEIQALDSQEDYNELQEMYASLVDHISLDSIRGGSIQIIGPIAQDKPAVMKLLLQNIIQKSPAVVINFTGQNRMPIKSQYDILVSFIHQIISQRPVLFRLVENLMAELLRHKAWSEQAIKGVLRSLFQQSSSTDFLVLMHDFESWPLEARSWLSEIPRWFAESSQSTCTFILSCQVFHSDITFGKLIRLDLNTKRSHKQLLCTECAQRFSRSLRSVSPFYQEFRADTDSDRHTKNLMISKISRLELSLASTRIYLDYLSQFLVLNPSATIQETLPMLPATEEQLIEYCIDSLISKHGISIQWAKLALTWAQLAVRPLQIEELAVATAIRMNHAKISDIESATLKDMERNFHKHLSGLITVENRSVFIDNPLVENILAQKVLLKGEPPGLYRHNDIALYCLHYLRIILGEVSSQIFDKYLTLMSPDHSSEQVEHISFAFLDYACRFWPIHFLQIEEADKDLEQAVVDFLLSNESKRWFRLYNALCEGCDSFANEAVVAMSERQIRAATGTEAMKSLDPKQSAIAMANYVGLFPIVCSLLNVDETDDQLNRCKVRRGCFERVVMFPDIATSYYLDCVISNDDAVAVKEIFNSNAKAATSWFPLHKAAWGGCLNVVQSLLELLDSPAQRNDAGRTPLHLAVLCGHVDVVRILVDSKFDMINRQDNDLKSPLIMATELGHVEIAQYLVQSGTDLALKDGAGKTAVHYAVLNSVHILEALLIYDKSVVDMKDQNSRTPLHFAAKYGITDAARAILKAAREVCHPDFLNFLGAYDKEGMTPLHLAAQSGHEEVVNVIIGEDGQTAKCPNIKYSLPEDVAAKHGHLSVIRAITRDSLERGDVMLVVASSSGQTLVVEYLLQNKVDPNGGLNTPQRPMTAAAASGWSNVIQILLKYHADVRLLDSDGLGPLHYAASEGHIEVMKLLFAHGADVHAITEAERTPLHLAAGNADSIKLLLDNSAEVEAEDVRGHTPLIAAVRTGCLESVRLLLDRGASLGSSNKPSKDALYSAISRDQASIVEEMFRRDCNRNIDSQWRDMNLAIGSKALNVLKFMVGRAPEAVAMISDRNTTLLWVAAGYLKLPDMLTILLEAGSDVNHQGPEGNTPLMEAVCIGNAAHVQQLITWKADVKCRNDNGDTALSLAASRPNLDVVKILIKAKAPIDDVNNSRETPIHMASKLGEVKIVQCLLEAGADVNICHEDTWSPLHAAANNFKIAKALTDCGADVNYQTSDGWSPLHLSASWGYPDIVQLLLDKGADPNLVNDAGMTALHLAIVDHEMKAFDVILAHQGSISVDINKPDGEGYTAIHLAIVFRYSVAANKLIAHGAEVNVTLENGLTYLDLAIDEDLPETLVALLGVDRLSPSRIPWDYQSLVVAYWRAVKKAQSKSIEALLRVNGALAIEVSKEGSNGLEEYMYLRSSEEGDLVDSSLPARFVKSGLDPFERRQGHPLTCFELGFMSKEEVDMEFLEVCLGSVPKKLMMGSSALGFKVLRIATEIENPNIWTRLHLFTNSATLTERDQDNWDLIHFLYQAMPRKQYANYLEGAFRQTKTPTALVWPHLWQRNDDDSVETRVEISTEGLEASFSARSAEKDPVTVRANFPFPPRGPGFVYFEVSIVQIAQEEPTSEVVKEKARVVIGLSGEFSNQAGAVPGRNLWSIGYDGIDGNIYEEADLCNENDRFADPYGVDQTVGCGIDYQDGEYFFTCDGSVIFRNSSDIIYRKLYPSIGHYGGGAVTVRVNFGEERFKWDMANVDKGAYKRLK